MSPPRVVLTAGHARSVAAEALAELMRRDGVNIAGLLVVRTLNLKRLRQVLRQRGLADLFGRVRAARRATRSGSTAAVGRRVPTLDELIQRHGIRIRGLRRWARNAGVPLRAVGDLNAPRAVKFVRHHAPDAVVYAGGGILRRAFLEAAGPVVNAHAGPLPWIRGMNAAEWAALLGAPAAVTIHLIDEGIDTGPVIASFPVARDACATVEELREAAVVAGIEGMQQVIAEGRFRMPPHREAGQPPERQCFIMAPALRQILAGRLARGCGTGTGP